MKPAPTKVNKGGRQPVPRPQPRPAPQSGFAMREHYLLGGVLAITALVYLRCLGNAYVFDDHEMIIVNRYIGEWSFLWKAFVNDSWWFRDPLHLPQSHYYRPLQDVWLGLNYQLFGLNPVGPHALMVGLHLAAVALGWRIAARLSGDTVVGILAALLFGLLPVHAEAVVWATAIPESLAGTMQLGAFCLYLRYRDDRLASSLGWSMALFAGALLSHEGAIAFPILVAVHGFLFADGREVPAAESSLGARLYQRSLGGLTLAIPFILVAVVYLATRIAVLGFIAKRDVNNQATLAQILLTIPTVVAHNLAVIINPWQAGPSHRITWVNSMRSADFWMPATGLALIALAGLMALSDSPKRRLYLFSVAWIFIAMAPVLNLGILYPNALVADRYMYFASYGWCLLVSQAAVATARANLALARPIGAVVGFGVVLCGLTLWQVQHYWHDEIALFSRCIERFPDSGFCHNRLGMALQAVGDLKGAEQELTTAFKLDPTDFAAEYDLAMVHEQQERHQDAAREAADALKHLANAPPSAYVSLAQLYEAIGDHNASESAFGQAGRLPGGAYEVALARARIKLNHRDGAGAEQQLRPLLTAAPDDPGALLMLGSALAIQQRYEEALAAYEHAASVVPGNTTLRFLIALTLHNLGRNQEALTQCQLVLQAAPGNPNATQLLQLIEHDLRAQPVKSGAAN
jgi:tetratricopeptide (TPR) repeat protein